MTSSFSKFNVLRKQVGQSETALGIDVHVFAVVIGNAGQSVESLEILAGLLQHLCRFAPDRNRVYSSFGFVERCNEHFSLFFKTLQVRKHRSRKFQAAFIVDTHGEDAVRRARRDELTVLFHCNPIWADLGHKLIVTCRWREMQEKFSRNFLVSCCIRLSYATVHNFGF